MDIINAFPGYTFENGHNMYRGVDVGKGGYVYAEPGIYTNVALLDVGNMHGASILALNKFGEYTKNYKDIRDARMAIKHRDYDAAAKMFDGKLKPYLTEEGADGLQNALKLVLNTTYGIAAATFDNPLRDPRDVNNIIALRGALFMKTLQDDIVSRGFKVIHCKTDSCKVPNATPEIIDYIIEFGRKYGYEFEHEATYERICLVNDAVYIAKYDDQGVRNKGGKHAGEWTATGKQFQVPFVFKQLFSKEEIVFDDMCEVKEVSKGGTLYLDMNEGLEKDEHNYRFIGRVGRFCPVKAGSGGGELFREKEGKYSYAPGCKGYRWLESEVVKTLGKEDDIDKSYYISLCDAAIETINKYGSFDRFVADEPYVDMSFMNIPDGADVELPW